VTGLDVLNDGSGEFPQMTLWPEFFRPLPSCDQSSFDAALLGEPALEELLDDPVMQTVMRRDGVTRLEILSLMRRFQKRRAALSTDSEDYASRGRPAAHERGGSAKRAAAAS
jgi:hypothetical protein